MKILYVVNKNKDTESNLGAEVLDALLSLGYEVFTLDSKYGPIVKDFKEIEFVAILGGDGTIIDFARKYKQYSLPIFGINNGRVGALAVSELSNYKRYLEKIKAGDYKISERIALDITFNGVKETAFNEISVSRGDNKIGNFLITVNDKYEDSFYGDGLLISTPTGSSAYNYSAGGPILLETNSSYVLTPICPQFIAFNSVVLSQSDELTIRICKNDGVVSCDGCSKYQISNNDEIKIKVGDTKLRLIDFNERSALYGAVYKIAKSIYKN